MRIEKESIAFTGVATGGTLADFNLQDASAFAVLLEIASHAGTATATHPDLVPRIGATTAAATADAVGSADLAALTGLFPLLRIGAGGAAKTAFLVGGPWMPVVLKEMRLRATLTGAGHTITGTVHVFRRFE